MNTIWHVCLEPIDNRYTAQWYTAIPENLRQLASSQNIAVEVVTIDGEAPASDSATPGAFLNFAATNGYKASQISRISELFTNGRVQAGDAFLITDIWNFAITAIKYMSELLDIPVKIHSIAHAGAYDPTDILGMKMSKPWPWHQERAWYYACDRTWYATDFHRQMFLRNLNIPTEDHGRAFVSGQPHSEIIKSMAAMPSQSKQGVIWPHRYNPDKQPEIAENLAGYTSEPWCITQKLNLSKADYYVKLAQSQVLFSCSLHENLGISIMEGVLAGVIPVLPARCSYTEMYLPEFLYPSKWTQDWDHYLQYRDELVAFIQHRIDNPEYYADALQAQRRILEERYLSAENMYQSMLADIVSAQKTK
jgi:hypothetical protein